MIKLKKSKRIKAYFKKNKKREWEKTKIRISFKIEHQTPLLMIIREYYNKRTNEITFAEILFEIE